MRWTFTVIVIRRHWTLALLLSNKLGNAGPWRHSFVGPRALGWSHDPSCCACCSVRLRLVWWPPSTLRVAQFFRRFGKEFTPALPFCRPSVSVVDSLAAAQRRYDVESSPCGSNAFLRCSFCMLGNLHKLLAMFCLVTGILRANLWKCYPLEQR